MSPTSWIRGVNLGGWLLLERFISPYLFAITTCHLEGQFCFYPGQLGAPPSYNNNNNSDNASHDTCDLDRCKPVTVPTNSDAPSQRHKQDFPRDAGTLLSLFEDPAVASRYLQYHYDNMIQKEDLVLLQQHKVTHVRVPMPYTIVDSTNNNSNNKHESFLLNSQDAWLYFMRLVSWCRELKLQVWAAVQPPPSQSEKSTSSCTHWSHHSPDTMLRAVEEIAQAIVRDGLADVVTGFGISKQQQQQQQQHEEQTVEHYHEDCDFQKIQQYQEQALEKAQNILGPTVSLFVATNESLSRQWNNHTYYLDRQANHVVAKQPLSLSPRQHIARVCRQEIQATNDTANDTTVAGVMEWSAAFDTNVASKLDQVMQHILQHGEAYDMDRQVDPSRREFLKTSAQAQMVAYEGASSIGWFYETLKTEGGAFAEWDFLRGVQEGWIPPFPDAQEASQDLYGTCQDILSGMDNDDEDMSTEDKVPLDEEHHEDSHNYDEDKILTISDDDPADDDDDDRDEDNQQVKTSKGHRINVFAFVAMVFFAWAIKRVFFADYNPFRRSQYHALDTSQHNPVAMAV